jgi:hypothetical protein
LKILCRDEGIMVEKLVRYNLFWQTIWALIPVVAGKYFFKKLFLFGAISLEDSAIFLGSIFISFLFSFQRIRLTESGWELISAFTWNGKIVKRFFHFTGDRWEKCEIQRDYIFGINPCIHFFVFPPFSRFLTADYPGTCRFLLDHAHQAVKNQATIEYLQRVAGRGPITPWYRR